MRKTTKTITEVIHEHGVISFEVPLYERLLDIASMDGFRDEHRDIIVEKTIKCTEEEEGEPLTMEHLPKIVAGIPGATETTAEYPKTL
jgi:hypothetical protein